MFSLSAWFFGAGSALGCGRDRETGLLSPPRNAFDLICAPQHNYRHADCSALVGRITVAVLGWGRTAFTHLFKSKLVNIRMNQKCMTDSVNSHKAVCLPFFSFSPFDTRGKYVIWV